MGSVFIRFKRRYGIENFSPRTVNYLNQVSGSILYKIFGIIASFLVVPVMVHYLGHEKYGIWSTLLSIISWVLLFDLGLSNGTRNKVAETLALNNKKKARIYISTSYFSIGALSFVIYLLIFIASGLIDWQVVFNTKAESSEDLCKIIRIVSFFILFNFIISIVNNLYHAVQKSSAVVFGQFLTNISTLIFVYLLSKIVTQNIIYLAWVYGLVLVNSTMIMSFYFYKKNPDLIPALRHIKKDKINDLLELGIKFFIIQLSGLVIFTTDKIIITQLFGPEFVTPYDIVFKLFSIVIIANFIIVTPLWSAFTEAFTNNDYVWINSVINKFNLSMIPFIIFTVLLVLASPFIIKIWIGDDIYIPSSMLVSMGGFVIINTWNNNYASFVNGIGLIKPQMYSAILAGIINIPVSIFLAKNMGMHTSGIILGTILSLSIGGVVVFVQTRFILKRMNSKQN